MPTINRERAGRTQVSVTLEIEADIPAGVPDDVVRTVTENARTLKSRSQGFETECIPGVCVSGGCGRSALWQ